MKELSILCGINEKNLENQFLIFMPILNSEDWWLIVEARCLVIIYLFISILASTWEELLLYATRSVGNCISFLVLPTDNPGPDGYQISLWLVNLETSVN